ncbi:MAG: MerR family transcriptional regulator [Pseudomonadota bacterium]|nr:MerR family transcriptional regulator [Pseudomonadota bacterium]
MDENKYTIDCLVELSGFSRRTIRYYVQEGLIDPPAGRGRGGFYYDSHLERLRLIKAYQEKGIRISAIAAMLSREEPAADVAPSRNVMIRYEIAPGIELNVSREREISEAAKILEIIRIAKTIVQGKVKDE